jgi:hypothetical protein
MIKYILLLLLTTNAYAKTVDRHSKPPEPVKKQHKKTEQTISKNDLMIIYGATELITKLEGFTSVFILDFDKKTQIIGHGDKICASRYNIGDTITKKQAKNCVIEAVFNIFVKLKKELPNLKSRQYVGLIDLIYNVNFNKNVYKNGFYSSRLFKLLKYNPQNKYRIIYEWQDCAKVNGKFEKSILNRRNKELKIFFGN